MDRNLLIDVAELGVPVRVPRALDGLGVALQAEPLLPEQVPGHVRADLVASGGQLAREIGGRLDVHRSGDIGSPGSTRASSAGTSPDPPPPPACGGPAVARPSDSASTSSSVKGHQGLALAQLS